MKMILDTVQDIRDFLSMVDIGSVEVLNMSTLKIEVNIITNSNNKLLFPPKIDIDISAKIKLIKVIRNTIGGAGLWESKQFVDSGGNIRDVFSDVTEYQASVIRKTWNE